MKPIKLLLLSSMLFFFCCNVFKNDSSFYKYYRVNKSGLKVVSKDCPELRRMIKEGQMYISKKCDFDCLVYFEKELYEYSVLESETFFSNLCVKTKDEIDEFFGFETNTIPWFGSTRLVVLIITYKKVPDDFLSLNQRICCK